MTLSLIKELLIIALLAIVCIAFLWRLLGFKGTMKSAIENAIDDNETLDEAIDDALEASDEFQEAIELSRQMVSEQRKTNLLLEQI